MVGGYPIPGVGGTPVRSGWWGGTLGTPLARSGWSGSTQGIDHDCGVRMGVRQGVLCPSPG